MRFGEKKIGEKVADDTAPEEKSKGLGDEAASVAVRALAKAFGIDADSVDTEKAARAFRAAMTACRHGGDDE